MSLTIHTTLGDLKFELYCEQAPKACENFLALSASGYYDNTLFHRNIKGFIIQGGDPTGTGKGGESIYSGEKFEDEIDSTLRHDSRGVLSMANSGPNTNGSQFFITYTKQENLDDKYTIFGHLIYGFDTLEKMEKEPTGKLNRPLNEIILKGVSIHANPIADDQWEEAVMYTDEHKQDLE